jgi:DeoR/GlpR family transcriptional regulator of sugar metabolism
MLMAERRRRILDSVRSRRAVSIRELVDLLETSEITVRRDLRAMAADGLLRRTHGGAILPADLAYEPTYTEKSLVAAREKETIAARAAGLVEPGDSILLGPGTTTLALAIGLARMEELSVVTNSLLVAQAFMNAPGVDVLMTGGTLRRSIHALVGPATEQAFAEVRATKAFISGNGLTADRGLTTPNLLSAAADRALAAAARHVVVLADYTKIGVETMFQTVPCERIGTLVTDSNAEGSELRAIRDAGVQVLVAHA